LICFGSVDMPPCRRAAPDEEVATERKKKLKEDHVTSDSNEDISLFDIFQHRIQTAIQTTTPDSDDDKPLFPGNVNFVDNPIVTNGKIRRQLDKVVAGGDKIRFMFPLPDANLEGQVALLIQAANHFHGVKSLELQATAAPFPLIVWTLIPFVFGQGVLISDMPTAFDAVLNFVISMRDKGRKFQFLGLSTTSLTNYQGRRLADMIRLLGPTNRGRDEWEKIELQRIGFSEPTRAALKDAGDRCGVNVILGRDRGP
jgi:hypothetical protein